MNKHFYSRRDWLRSAGNCGRSILTLGTGSFLATMLPDRSARGDEKETAVAEGVGDVKTPRFYRHDIGTAPGRLHEPSAGTAGNIWSSPLDGNLWQYDTKTGTTKIHNLEKLTGRKWKGLHLWPIARGPLVYLCTPSLPELYVWDRELNRVTSHKFPHDKPSVYGGFVDPSRRSLYFYDTRHASVLKWNPETKTGENFPCPYKLSDTLYMSFIDRDRQEYWGYTWTGNDVVRFDMRTEQWTGHFQCPLQNATTLPGGKIFHGNTLYVSDMLNGRIIPLNVEKNEWGDPIPVPGFRDWFGYLSGGFLFRDKLYIDHSTWTGGKSSIDGEQHHFIGSWSVFDPATHKFSRLDIPTRSGEQLKYLMSDYCATCDDHLFILAVNQKQPKTVIVLQSKPHS
jgi:hypothetical protein